MLFVSGIYIYIYMFAVCTAVAKWIGLKPVARSVF